MGAVRAVFIHSGRVPSCFSERMNQFHVDFIERSLHQEPLEENEKLEIIDRIACQLKLRERNGAIQ